MDMSYYHSSDIVMTTADSCYMTTTVYFEVFATIDDTPIYLTYTGSDTPNVLAFDASV